MTTTTAEPVLEADRLLDAVERLCYANGVHSVGMDVIRTASGLSLKRIYQLYPGKQELVVAFLERRDARWRTRLATYVGQTADSRQRVLTVFDWLHQWFAEPDFRGCAWINVYGELGATSAPVAAAVRAHKSAFRRYLSRLLADGGYSRTLAEPIYLLAEGAIVTAAIRGNPNPAKQARAAAAVLLAASGD